MSRTTWHVTPHEDGWQVIRQGATAATSVHGVKSTAIDAAVELAKRNRPSQVIIHGEDGRIQDERTYGSDPYPPRG